MRVNLEERDKPPPDPANAIEKATAAAGNGRHVVAHACRKVNAEKQCKVGQGRQCVRVAQALFGE